MHVDPASVVEPFPSSDRNPWKSGPDRGNAGHMIMVARSRRSGVNPGRVGSVNNPVSLASAI